MFWKEKQRLSWASRYISWWFNRWEGVSTNCFMCQAIRYRTTRQIHSNLYSCSAKLLWVFKLTVMFSNWNINLFKPLIWSPQWRITKYFIVSDLLKFYNQLPWFHTWYSWCWSWGWLFLPPIGPKTAPRGWQGALQVGQPFFKFSPSLGFTSVFKATDTSLKVKVLVTQSRPILWDPRDCSLSVSSVLGVLQARILE